MNKKQLEEKVVELERAKRGVEEMLYLVLEEVGEPVQVEAAKMQEKVTADRAIDITLDSDGLYWTFRTLEIAND